MQANFLLKAHYGVFRGSWTGMLMCWDFVITLIHASAHYGAQLDVIEKSRHPKVTLACPALMTDIILRVC